MYSNDRMLKIVALTRNHSYLPRGRRIYVRAHTDILVISCNCLRITYIYLSILNEMYEHILCGVYTINNILHWVSYSSQ